MKKIVLSLLTVFMFLSLSVVLVKANENATTVSLEDGVQIRTDGNNGLRWVANVENHVESNEYGFLFAKGDLAEVTVETVGVAEYVVDGVTAEEPVMSATMTKFPKSAAAQDISVVAYVLADGVYTYSNVVVRNLAEVAIAAKNTIDGEFVNAISEYVGENYKKTFTDAQGSLYYDNALYETNHLALAEEFIKDWNAKFGTELDAKTAFVTVSYDSPFRKSARSSGTDATTSGLYKFFNDEKMSVKWGWLLDYILEELKSGVGYDPCKYQIEVIRGAENTNTSNWYYGFNTVSYIQSIFNAKGTSAGSGQFKFENSPEKLTLISKYNNQVYTNGLYSKFIAKEGEIQLPAIAEKTGYTSKWMLGENSYVGNDNYVLEAETNYLFVRKYTPITYSVKFYNGEEQLTTLSTTYNVENEVTLPQLELDGYNFLGWYADPSLSGDSVTTITTGTTGDKIYYAKVEEATYANVNVTLDANGGYFPLEYASNIETLGEYSNTGLASGIYFCDTAVTSNNSLRWQYKALLQYDSSLNAYKVVAVDGATAGINTVATNAGVTWTHAIASSSIKVNTQYNVGDYIIFLKTPALKDKELKYIKTNDPSNAYPTSLNMVLSEPTSLIVPTHNYYTFTGWKSSVDDSVVTTYPGYSSNPGDITYTAQWVTQLQSVTVNFDTNGGAFVNYNTVDEAIADFLKDYNKARGKSHTIDTFYALGSWTEVSDASLFLYNETYKAKWTWLVNYIAGVAGGSNKAAFVNFYNYTSQSELNAANSNYIYCIAYELRGWVGQSKYSKNTNFVTADYSSASVQSAFNAANTLPTSYVYTDPCTLPKPFKQGYTFKGWYTNESLTGDAVTTYPGYYTNPGVITYFAKWSSSIVVTYDTDPFTEVDNSIQLNAAILGELVGNFVWESKNTSIATVDQTGLVTGVKEGTVDIYVYDSGDPSVNLTVSISVIAEGLSDIFSIISEAHNNQVYSRSQLGIGAGTPVYYTDIYGSVSKILFNDSLVIDTTYANSEVDDYNTMRSLEFVTVHYTGNMSTGADALANAKYFASDNSTSIHYTTGNDGVYQALTHDKGAWHAGDSASVDHVGYFTWNATGVAYDGADLLHIEWSASNDFYFEINGKKTSIKLPSTYNYSSRNTDHIFNSNGTISSQSDYTGGAFSNRSAESFFNDWGFPVKVVNGEYYMGTTWWCYSQVHEGRICASGGNLNSIGIESCVDKGSDLWYTWQKTAQLVAKLCYDNNLGLERIRPHHAYTAKDCPQPMLENNMEIWWEFMDLVKYEYELLTKFSNYTISFVSNNTEYVSNTGRVIKVPEDDTVVSYTITLTDKTTGVSNSVTYFSTIPGSEG